MGPPEASEFTRLARQAMEDIVAIFYPFSQFCETNISLLSLQRQPGTAQNLFQMGVEYGKYGGLRADREPRRGEARLLIIICIW